MARHQAKLEYDRNVDALYIYLRDLPYAFGEDLDPQRRIDYAADHLPIGIELLGVSKGVNIDDLPERETVIRLLQRQDVKILSHR